VVEYLGDQHSGMLVVGETGLLEKKGEKTVGVG
jgi:hypothetical protein